MWIRVIAFGTNWWSPHSRDLNDPLCFRKNAVWFNSAGLKSGRRLRLCWVYPGHIRFNRNSGFHPEFPRRALDKIFFSDGPKRIDGRLHLLLSRAGDGKNEPSRFIVTMTSELHGQIVFTSRSWKSAEAQPISISLSHSRYEAMLLIGSGDWIKTNLGYWSISNDGRRVELRPATEMISA
jgi:hypothetical protein